MPLHVTIKFKLGKRFCNGNDSAATNLNRNRQMHVLVSLDSGNRCRRMREMMSVVVLLAIVKSIALLAHEPTTDFPTCFTGHCIAMGRIALWHVGRLHARVQM